MIMRASVLRSAVRAASKKTTTNDAGRKPVARGMSATTACVGRRGRAVTARGRGAATRAAAEASEETATDREPVKLLTSDESDNLLRIRHTVRARRRDGG
jgi:hypothetical protein